MTDTQRYLGIDVGTRRIGLATGDAQTRIASPLTTTDAAGLAEIFKREGPFTAVVVGLPRNLAGQDTPQTLTVRHFCDDVLGRLNIEPVFMDEAATSAIAEERLKASGRPYSKGDIDAEAASIILQDYLDSL